MRDLNVIPLISHISAYRTLRLSLVDSFFVPTHYKYEMLKRVTLADFKCFAHEFVKEMRVVSLMQGNLVADEAHRIMANVLNTLQYRPVRSVSIYEMSCQERQS